MNNTRRWLIGTGAAILLLVGGVSTVRHYQKSNWIAQQVFTVSMSELRARSANGRLEAHKLIPSVQEDNSRTAYSVIYYPECHTVLATVELTGIEQPQFYLVFEDGTSIKGWYMPELVKFDITHVAFEGLESQAFVSLDFVDGAKLGEQQYDPAAESDARVARFSLAMPPPRPYSWSNPAPASSSGASSGASSSASAQSFALDASASGSK